MYAFSAPSDDKNDALALMRGLLQNDVELALGANVDDASLSRLARDLMHRLSLRADITARLQGLDVGLARHLVLWSTLDYYSAEG